MHLCQCHRYAVAPPSLEEERAVAVDAFAQHAYRVDLRIADAPISPPSRLRIKVETVIEKAIARHVIVEPHDVGTARLAAECFELFRRDARPQEVVPEGM